MDRVTKRDKNGKAHCEILEPEEIIEYLCMLEEALIQGGAELYKCQICGKAFVARPKNGMGREVCSNKCQQLLCTKRATESFTAQRRKKISAKGLTLNLQKGTPAAQKSPKSGSFETNVNADFWEIRSPEGIIYEFKNLHLWVKEHSNLLPGTPKQAESGIKAIKRSMLGKRRPVSQWKGWELISWQEKTNIKKEE